MKIQRITAHMLSHRFGGSARFWERRRPAMVKAGLLNKIGRSFFGSIETIERAIVGSGPEVWDP